MPAPEPVSKGGQWITTAAMADKLSISVRTLSKYQGELFQEGRHYRRQTPNGRAWLWNESLSISAWAVEVGA